jgi:glutamate racemase
MEKSFTIGIFDSGVGGLTVLSELYKLIPHSTFHYFADNAHCPYGPKGAEEIIKLSSKITEFLIAKQCDIVVVACNTATAAAIDHLRTNYKIPFVGMEPAVKPAALNTKTNSIGVLATAGTFNGRLYRETTSRYAVGVKVNYQVGEGLVELVEAGKSNSEEVMVLLMKYINPMLAENIDHLVLGCTHYPFFTPKLKELLPPNVVIVNPAPAVAQQTVRMIEQMGNPTGSNVFSVNFYSSGGIEILKELVELLESTVKIEFERKQFYPNSLV